FGDCGGNSWRALPRVRYRVVSPTWHHGGDVCGWSRARARRRHCEEKRRKRGQSGGALFQRPDRCRWSFRLARHRYQLAARSRNLKSRSALADCDAATTLAPRSLLLRSEVDRFSRNQQRFWHLYVYSSVRLPLLFRAQEIELRRMAV